MLDKRSILEESTGMMVAQYFGLDIVSRGSRNYIKCPGHVDRLGREDKNIGNCVLTEKGYHCYSCNKSVDTIGMVREIANCEFADALKILADMCGGEKYFSVDNNQQEIDVPFKNVSFLGMQNPNKCLCIVDVCTDYPDSDIYPLSKYTYQEKDGLYYVYKKQRSPLLNMLNKDEKTLKKLLKKFTEKYKTENENALLECSRESNSAPLIYDMFEQNGELSETTICKLQNYFQGKVFLVKEFERKNHLL